MLTQLRIRNLAVIDDVVVPVAAGFNALTGETGAGKSIIVEALGLLVGERASADVVRTGADKAVVEGSFDLSARPDLQAQLDERGVECEDGVLVLKREVQAAGGRSRAWANGSPVTTGVLASVGRLLVDVHGQHEAQTLLDADSQRVILDAFGDAHAQAAAVAEAHAAWQAAVRAAASLDQRRAEAERRADWLRHVVAELGDAALQEGEEERLADEARRLEHAEELRGHALQVAEALDGEGEGVLSRVGQLQRELVALQRIDPATERLQQLYDAAFYALDELARAMRAYGDGIESDPERLADVEARRDRIFRLTRKHGGTVASALRVLADAREELDLLDTAGVDRRAFDARVAERRATLDAACAALSARRAAAAEALSAEVDALLPALGMPDGRVTVRLTPAAEPGPHGAEAVEFVVALNAGHEPRPLARVASGGELARVMLALKTILARQDRVPTLVFDEVDAGIGGKVGAMVGDAMRRVAAHHQVFAITHLPQIAARAHHHIVVAKGARGGVTTSDVAVVTDDARVAEVARLLGGDPESATSREHARELLAVSAPTAARTRAAAPGRPRRTG